MIFSNLNDSMMHRSAEPTGDFWMCQLCSLWLWMPYSSGNT